MKYARECFPSPGLVNLQDCWYSGEAAAVASDAGRLAASTAGLVKVRAISGTLPTGSCPELPSGQRPQVDYLVAAHPPFFLLFENKTKPHNQNKTSH